MRDKDLHIKIDRELQEKLKELAKESGMTISSLVRFLITKAIKKGI